MKEEFIKLAKIARTDPAVIEQVSLKMAKITNKENVLENLVHEMELVIEKKLKDLELENPTAEQTHNALMAKLQANDQKLYEHYQYPDFSKQAGYQKVLDDVKEIVGLKPSFYLKKEPALDLFRKNPPRKIMKALGYTDLEKMLQREDWLELFAALRVVEDPQWVNTVFFKPYSEVKPEDFEERTIACSALSDKWAKIAEEFAEKKLHHMSHLKEIGLVFVIPMGTSGAPGELIYLLFMTMHYLFEVDWHSHLFKKYSSADDFTEKMIAALMVKTTTDPLPNGDKMSFRIVPSYLAKKDLNDVRLKEPRISPEDWHYIRAGDCIKAFAEKYPEIGLDFWNDLHYVASVFPSNSQTELISFNMYDSGVGLLKKDSLQTKYIYHQMDALWNEIFIRYLGREKLNQYLMDNLDKGYLTL